VQGALARVARGMPLPVVHADADALFVIASRLPNEAVEIPDFTPGIWKDWFHRIKW